MTEPVRLRGKRVTVVGLGVTGLEVANFLSRAGARVTVSENTGADKLEVDIGALDKGVEIELGGHRPETFRRADLIIPSPGVPRDMLLLKEAGMRGTPVMSEVELAGGMIDKPILAVTGTNGKSTTVSLLGAMLSQGGLAAPVVGNIGTPLISMVERQAEYDCLAVEISSFQLEWVSRFHPRIAAILNVTDDHLDRYRDADDYLETKLRIGAQQGPEDILVLNGDDTALIGMEGKTPAKVVWFSHGPVSQGVFLEGTALKADLEESGNPAHVLDTGDLKLVGVHNVENVMAAAAMALAYGIPEDAVQKAAVSFEGLPHRNELVAELDGVRYYDDSKGTNVGAARKSLESFPGPVILIAGGRDKGGGYEPLAQAVSRNVKLLILIGEAKRRMARELKGLTSIVEAATLDEAVEIAAVRAIPGDVVLLSPACSSFDMFKNYQERGEVFRQAVRRLPCRGR